MVSSTTASGSDGTRSIQHPTGSALPSTLGPAASSSSSSFFPSQRPTSPSTDRSAPTSATLLPSGSSPDRGSSTRPAPAPTPPDSTDAVQTTPQSAIACRQDEDDLCDIDLILTCSSIPGATIVVRKTFFGQDTTDACDQQRLDGSGAPDSNDDCDRFSADAVPRACNGKADCIIPLCSIVNANASCPAMRKYVCLQRRLLVMEGDKIACLSLLSSEPQVPA